MQNFRFALVTSVLHGLVEQAAIEVVVTPPVFQGLVELTAFEIFIEFFVISPVFQGLVELLFFELFTTLCHLAIVVSADFFCSLNLYA